MRFVSICIVASLMDLSGMDSAVAGPKTAAEANVSVSAWGGGDLQPHTKNEFDEDFDFDAGRPTEAAAPARMERGEGSDAHAVALATATATARIGHLGISVVGAATGGGGWGRSVGTAMASWEDTISIFAPGHLAIRAEFKLSIDGEFGVHAFGNAFSQANLTLASPGESKIFLPNDQFGTGIITLGFKRKSPLGEDAFELPRELLLTVIPPEGPFNIGLRLNVTGQTETNLSTRPSDWSGADQGAYFAELSRSVTWGGLVGVYDFFTGEKLDKYTITSESGFDFSKPFQVPEPASMVLVSCGIGVLSTLATLRRRRRCNTFSRGGALLQESII